MACHCATKIDGVGSVLVYSQNLGGLFFFASAMSKSVAIGCRSDILID